jgi:GTP cyclohydrolase II
VQERLRTWLTTSCTAWTRCCCWRQLASYLAHVAMRSPYRGMLVAQEREAEEKRAEFEAKNRQAEQTVRVDVVTC